MRHRGGDAAAPSRLVPTVAEVLHLDELQAGVPEVLAGEASLDRAVRWVHVSETAAPAALLNGGELLLSTGVGWPEGAGALADYVDQLSAVGVAGLVLELGGRFALAPAAVVERARALGLPFIVLHREVRFVSITEAVHRRIISEHTLALQAKDRVHATFTELGLRGSPADFIVSKLASVLGAAVVLEDRAHQIIAVDALGRDLDVLEGWEGRSRLAHRAAEADRGDGASAVATHEAADDTGWLVRHVEVRGTRWGSLVALPGPGHPAGRGTVLDQGAVALALSRLSDASGDEWMRLSHRTLLDAVLTSRFDTSKGLAARFEAAGVAISGRRLVGVALAGDVDVAPVIAAARTIGALALASPQPGQTTGDEVPLLAVLSLPSDRAFDAAAADAFASAVAEHTETNRAEGRALTMAVGVEVDGIAGLAASIESAIELLRRERVPAEPRSARAAGVLGRREPRIVRVADRPLLALMSALADDPRVRAHVERMLGPLLDYDANHDADLVDVLAAHLAHPGNRTKAAASSHVSRSVFYQRLALIEHLLGVDLADGETLAALHAALLARS